MDKLRLMIIEQKIEIFMIFLDFQKYKNKNSKLKKSVIITFTKILMVIILYDVNLTN